MASLVGRCYFKNVDMDTMCSFNKLDLLCLLAGKRGEELLHEVAARYVKGMEDMDGRKPGPSSILGETEP